jgi:hypothetical protein
MRIKTTTKVMIAVALLLPTGALAQQREFYDARTSKIIGRTTTDSSGATTIYDSTGRVSGRTSTGSDGTVTVYGSDGRRSGTVTSTKQPSTSK